MPLPVNKIIVQRLDSAALGFGTMVFRIRETTDDHNIVIELLKGIRHDYPGVWYQFMTKLATELPNSDFSKLCKKEAKIAEEWAHERATPVYIAPPETNDERTDC
jgi:hypothetical protein